MHRWLNRWTWVIGYTIMVVLAQFSRLLVSSPFRSMFFQIITGMLLTPNFDFPRIRIPRLGSEPEDE